ncbi:MAG: UDP-2,3-diacylglucosamine diphosphatase [Candidatus Hodarchaeota archaeon]
MIKESDYIEETIGENDEILIAISDVHLGFIEKDPLRQLCDKEGINEFFRQIRDGKIPCNTLIICGDFFDMWRRDFAGIFVENYDTISILEEIDEKPSIKLYFVVGNHDYYLRKLKNHFYPFPFLKALKLKHQETEFRFVHGYQFDPIQIKAFFDILCLSDDNIGYDMESFWKKIKLLLRAFKGNPVKIIKNWRILPNLLLKPSIRKAKGLGINDQEVIEYARKKQCNLIYGHTHEPTAEKTQEGFIVANCGSWVDPEPNTYVEINVKKKKVRLQTFKDGIIDLIVEKDY